MEIWKKLNNYPGYEVSNEGRIKSYRQTEKGRILAGKKTQGYIGIDLRLNGETKQELLHRLVLSTFNPIVGWEKLTVNHINGNKEDNRLENLEWMSLSENVSHARRVLQSGNGTKKVHIITLKREEYYFDTTTDAAEFCGVTKGTISRWANKTRSYKGKYRLVEYL